MQVSPPPTTSPNLAPANWSQQTLIGTFRPPPAKEDLSAGCWRTHFENLKGTSERGYRGCALTRGAAEPWLSSVKSTFCTDQIVEMIVGEVNAERDLYGVQQRRNKVLESGLDEEQRKRHELKKSIEALCAAIAYLHDEIAIRDAFIADLSNICERM
jgi:hypothetical protein